MTEENSLPYPTSCSSHSDTGGKIPSISFGTYKIPPNRTTSIVLRALEVGYRSIDTAKLYRNEKEVGEAIEQWLNKSSGNRREDIFITGKLWCTDHARVEEALDETLAKLAMNYLDLYLMHWPLALSPTGNYPFFPTMPASESTRPSASSPTPPPKSRAPSKAVVEPDFLPNHSFLCTWRTMCSLSKSKCRAVGISNFSHSNLLKLLEYIDKYNLPTPTVLQNEIHPLNPPSERLLRLCADRGIVVQAYSPLGGSGNQSGIMKTLMEAEIVEQLARKYEVTPAAVLIAYARARGPVVVKAAEEAHMKENLRSAVVLENSEVKELDHWFRAIEKQGDRAGEVNRRNFGWRRRVVKGNWGSFRAWDDESGEDIQEK